MKRWLSDEAVSAHQARFGRQKQVAITVAELPPPANKYGNEKTAGYDSRREAKRAAELKLLEHAGSIRNLREQVVYTLIPRQLDAQGKCIERECKYVADFVYEEPPMWHPVVEDCKGMRTALYRIKKKLMLHVHGIKIKET